MQKLLIYKNSAKLHVEIDYIGAKFYNNIITQFKKNVPDMNVTEVSKSLVY